LAPAQRRPSSAPSIRCYSGPCLILAGTAWSPWGFLGLVDNNEFHLANSYLDWRDKQTPFQAMTSMMPRDIPARRAARVDPMIALRQE